MKVAFRLSLALALAVLAFTTQAAPLRADCGVCAAGGRPPYCDEICACQGSFMGGVCMIDGTCFCL
jgi:hypothetical protein